MTKKAKPKKPAKPKNKGGRPTLFTEEIKESIFEYIQAGNNYTDACYLTGISQPVFHEWKKKGNDARAAGMENEFTEFVDKIEAAKAHFRAFCVQSVANHLPTDGNLAFKALERLDYERFGRKDSLKVDATVEATLKPSMEELHREARERRIELEKERAAREKKE